MTRFGRSGTIRWAAEHTTSLPLASQMPAPPGVIRTPELARVDNARSRVWTFLGQIAGVPAADIATVTFTVVLTIGLGSQMSEVRFTVDPSAGPFQQAFVPAASFSVRYEFSGTIVDNPTRSYISSAWIAPFTPDESDGY